MMVRCNTGAFFRCISFDPMLLPISWIKRRYIPQRHQSFRESNLHSPWPKPQRSTASYRIFHCRHCLTSCFWHLALYSYRLPNDESTAMPVLARAIKMYIIAVLGLPIALCPYELAQNPPTGALGAMICAIVRKVSIPASSRAKDGRFLGLNRQ